MTDQDTKLTIGPGTAVTLHFSLKTADAVVDSTFEREPARFVVGDGNLLPGFEKALFGLSEGSRESIDIKPEQGFGMPNPNNLQYYKRDQFTADQELAEGAMFMFSDAAKGEVPGVIKTLEADQVEVDFNHPLAGLDLLFDVEIIAVEPVNTDDN